MQNFIIEMLEENNFSISKWCLRTSVEVIVLGFSMMTLSLALFASTTLWAHGENKPGPHGGHIRMPGPFHTELVVKNEKTIFIYLLDMEFKNPVVTESSVTLSLKSGDKSKSFPCKPDKDKFKCESPIFKLGDHKGELLVEATRLGVKANSASYTFPLPQWPTMKEKSKTPSGDSHHHH